MNTNYTGCIDLERILSSIETLSSVENCINNVDLTSYFEEIELYMNNINFEHGNCISNYKDLINTMYDKFAEVKKEINLLIDALNTTYNKFSEADTLTESDIRDLSEIYSDTNASQNINNILDKNINLNISNSVSEFNNSNSVNEILENSGLSEYLIENKGLKQADIESLASRYITEYGVSNEDASTLANLKYELEAVRKNSGTQSELDSISARLGVIEKKYNINLRSVSSSTTNSNNSSTTTTSNSSYNTVPIGLGIAAAGITGAIGAVIVDNQKYKKNKRRKNTSTKTTEDIELEGEYVDQFSSDVNYSTDIRPSLDELNNESYASTSYHASRDKQTMDKFYDETDDFFYRDDE